MNKIQCLATAGLLLGVSLSAPATITVTDFSNGGSGSVYTASGAGSQIIPDNTPAGVAYAFDFSTSGVVQDLSVTLNISGGYNGDLYAYLAHGSQIAYLLIPDAAVTGSGFNITLVEGTSLGTIPTGGSGILGGTGSPLSYNTAIDLGTTFNGTEASGTWTIFFADLSPGDNSTVNSFNVVTVVPEPANMTLAMFGGFVMLAGGWWRKRRITRQRSNHDIQNH